MKSWLPLVVSVLLVSACKTGNTSFSSSRHRENFMLQMSRTPCFGSCPVYSVKIYSSGLLVFEGKRFTEKSGCFYRKLNRQEFRQLKSAFRQSNFATMEEKYPVMETPPSDLPGCELAYRFGGRTLKKVVSKGWGQPEILLYLQNRVDSLWVGHSLQSCDK